MSITIAALVSACLDTPELEFSYHNYHAVGVDYLCLRRTPRLTVKAYLFREWEGVDLGHARGIVWPHNHRYAFSSHTLKGVVRNYRYKIDAGDEWWIQSYKADERRPSLIGVRCGLLAVREEVIVPGEAFVMTNLEELHTIAPEPGTIVLQFQGSDEAYGPTALLSREQFPQCGGVGQFNRPRLDLYCPVTDAMALAWVEEVRKALLEQ